MTEKDIQCILAPDMLKRQDLVFPNTKAIHKRFESDLVRVTKSGIVYEYEIKCSRSDFYADFKKVRKHILLKQAKTKINYFYFVCPYGVIPLQDVEAPYGLIYVKGKELSLMRKADKLHNNSIDVQTKDRLARSLAWKLFKS